MAMTAATDATMLPAADLDRRFYAFVLDRLIAWSIVAAVAWAAYHFLISRGGVGAGVLVIVGTLLLVGLVFAVVLGKVGTSPGKAALGLRVVHVGTGTPIGVLPAIQRTLILGVATLPTFGLGVATLAWTAVMDTGRMRRGWHDLVTDAVVVDVRPAPEAPAVTEQPPRQIVNLTAMRLVPPTLREPSPERTGGPRTGPSPRSPAGGSASTPGRRSSSRASPSSAAGPSHDRARRSDTSSRSGRRTCRCPRPTRSSRSRPTECWS